MENINTHTCVYIFFFLFSYFDIVNELIQILPIEQYIIDFVKDLREAKKLSQEDIGNIIGKSKSFIGNIESPNNRAKYNLNHINLLADHFNLSPKDFLPEKPIIKNGKKRKNK